MRRIKRNHQPVEEPATRARAIDKNAVHARRQPGYGEQAADLGLRHRLAIAPHHPARPVAVGADTGAKRHRLAAARHPRRDGPVITPGGLARQMLGLCPSQAATRCKKGDSFHQVGLAGPVLTEKQNLRRVDLEAAAVIIPEILNGQRGKPCMNLLIRQCPRDVRQHRQWQLTRASASARTAWPRHRGCGPGLARPGQPARTR